MKLIRQMSLFAMLCTLFSCNAQNEGFRSLSVEDYEKAMDTLPKDKTIALNCRSGKRSKNAAQILVKNGYTVIELDAGYNGWIGAGKPVVK